MSDLFLKTVACIRNGNFHGFTIVEINVDFLRGIESEKMSITLVSVNISLVGFAEQNCT